jgi:hypothetical protein
MDRKYYYSVKRGTVVTEYYINVSYEKGIFKNSSLKRCPRKCSGYNKKYNLIDI